ncbi:MAG: bifunctional methylenetetrahydrofolate dehydrogenase/methenyltetrahydrofolate cyclohydrolase FolD [Nitrospinales bacterium]
MAARIIDGKKVASEILARTAQRAADLKSQYAGTPGLAVVLVGDDPASAVYVRNKNKRCREIGFTSFEHRLPGSTRETQLLNLIRDLNRDKAVNGILVQLPLPESIDAQRILEAIDPEKDVDGFHPLNAGRLVRGDNGLFPCTPVGVIELLDYYKIDIEGKNAVVLGRSNIVGKPLAFLLLRRNATVTLCHSRTRDLPRMARTADLLIAAIGKPGFVTADMVRPGAVVVDVGINRVDGKLKGDVDFDPVAQQAAWITPVPGGVGPMTIAMLMNNTLTAFENQNRQESGTSDSCA